MIVDEKNYISEFQAHHTCFLCNLFFKTQKSIFERFTRFERTLSSRISVSASSSLVPTTDAPCNLRSVADNGHFLLLSCPFLDQWSYCFAKAVHSRAKLRTANSLSVRPFICVLSGISLYKFLYKYRYRLITDGQLSNHHLARL